MSNLRASKSTLAVGPAQDLFPRERNRESTCLSVLRRWKISVEITHRGRIGLEDVIYLRLKCQTHQKTKIISFDFIAHKPYITINNILNQIVHSANSSKTRRWSLKRVSYLNENNIFIRTSQLPIFQNVLGKFSH